MSEEKKEFTVTDRRFSSGEKTESDESRQASPTEETKDQAPKETGADEEKGKQRVAEEDIHLPEINFPTFIISMNASALVHLGVIADPSVGEKEKNLALAKQVIDTLSMLEEKTKGNLSKDEEGLLKNILYDLRIIYVKEKA